MTMRRRIGLPVARVNLGTRTLDVRADVYPQGGARRSTVLYVETTKGDTQTGEHFVAAMTPDRVRALIDALTAATQLVDRANASGRPEQHITEEG